MTTLSQSDYAKRKGWNRSTVTRLKQAGRLVMVDGLVDVEATEARLADTAGGRDDVAARHAAGRGEVEKVSRGGTPPPRVVGGEIRADAQARKESALADLAEMEAAEKRGALIPKEDVDAALKALGASVRARLDVLADQLAPVVAPVTEMDEVHALLAEQFRAVLAGVADDLARLEVAE